MRILDFLKLPYDFVMKILDLLFRKKKKKLKFPHDFAIVSLSESARKEGLNYDWNKMLTRYKGGEIAFGYPTKYSKEEEKYLKEKGIPIVHISPDGFPREPEFEFLEIGEFGEVIVRK